MSAFLRVMQNHGAQVCSFQRQVFSFPKARLLIATVANARRKAFSAKNHICKLEEPITEKYETRHALNRERTHR